MSINPLKTCYFPEGKMDKLKILTILVLFYSSYLFATSFIPVPLDRQLKSSYGVIHAVYKGSNYKKLSDGQVVTNASFRVLQSSGLKSSEIINKNDFKVIYPGGKWQGLVYNVPGSPTFTEGEEVVLLLSKGSRGFMVNNLKMGKYEIFEEDGVRYLGSSAFRSHPKLGKISFSDFERKLFSYFGSDFQSKHHDKYIANTNSSKKTGRKVASVDVENEDVKSNGMSIYWLVLIFGLMGSYSSYVMKRKR